MDAGHYDVSASYVEVIGSKTTIHTGSSDFDVIKLASQIKIKDLNATIYVGENETIKLEIELDARANDGNISIFINGVEFNTTTSKLTVNIPNLNATNYNVVAVYHGNNWYNESRDTNAFEVVKNPTPFIIHVTNSNVGGVEQINVTIPSDATGQVLLDIAGQHYYANVTGGLAQFNITGLNAGENKFNVTYIGNYKYLANGTDSSLTISKIQPTFVVNGTNITVGDDEMIKFETAEDITSAVIIEINNVNYTAFVTNGKGNLTVSRLAAGNYNVTLYFSENDKYLYATAKNNFTVNQTDAAIRIITYETAYGNNETITVYVNATGTVTIKVDGTPIDTVPLVDGFAAVNATGLAAGQHRVDVIYNGNADLKTNDNYTFFSITPIAPTITVGVENITYYDVEDITVTVNAGGKVPT